MSFIFWHLEQFNLKETPLAHFQFIKMQRLKTSQNLSQSANDIQVIDWRIWQPLAPLCKRLMINGISPATRKTEIFLFFDMVRLGWNSFRSLYEIRAVVV